MKYMPPTQLLRKMAEMLHTRLYINVHTDLELNLKLSDFEGKLGPVVFVFSVFLFKKEDEQCNLAVKAEFCS